MYIHATPAPSTLPGLTIGNVRILARATAARLATLVLRTPRVSWSFCYVSNNPNSRLIVGTGKYKSMAECAKAIKLSGAEIVTVAVRRVNISDKKKPLLMDYIDPKKITYLASAIDFLQLNTKLDH